MSLPVEAVGLGKRYGGTWALRDCSIQVPSGKVAGLIGPNGAGKTTLLNLAAGLLRPSAGLVRVFGRSPLGHPGLVLDRVGFLAQDAPSLRGLHRRGHAPLLPRLNAGWDQGRAETRLRGLNIPLAKRIGHLSGGQRSQVALTLALGKRPDLLLLDEPVARLDPLARRQFLQSLAEAVAEDGITVLLSSHLVSDLERVCDHLVIIAGGRVQVAGDPAAYLRDRGVSIVQNYQPADRFWAFQSIEAAILLALALLLIGFTTYWVTRRVS